MTWHCVPIVLLYNISWVCVQTLLFSLLLQCTIPVRMCSCLWPTPCSFPRKSTSCSVVPVTMLTKWWGRLESLTGHWTRFVQWECIGIEQCNMMHLLQTRQLKVEELTRCHGNLVVAALCYISATRNVNLRTMCQAILNKCLICPSA